MNESTDIVNFEQIKALLPHRHPFIFIDRLERAESGEFLGIKNITNSEFLVTDPITRKKIFPRMYVIEAMGQAAIGIFATNSHEINNKYRYLFSQVDKVTFHRDLFPGDRVKFKVEFEKVISTGAIIKASATVDENPVVEAKMFVAIQKI